MFAIVFWNQAAKGHNIFTGFTVLSLSLPNIRIFSLLNSGYSHGGNFSLFELGSPVSLGFGEFVEKGKTATLEQELGQRYLDRDETFYDSFVGRPIRAGKGHTAAKVFVNGDSPKVRTMSVRTRKKDEKNRNNVLNYAS